MEGIGAGGWLRLLGILLACAIGIWVTLVFISSSVIKWGLFGGIIVIGAVLLFAAWIFQRREARKAREWDEA
jgi:hypothetical protein